jgi:hypothetical protein
MPNTIQKYARTNSAAVYLDVSKSFLKKNMNKLFIEGVHFFKQIDCRIVLWKLDALDKWIEGNLTPLSPENNLILNQLIA